MLTGKEWYCRASCLADYWEKNGTAELHQLAALQMRLDCARTRKNKSLSEMLPELRITRSIELTGFGERVTPGMVNQLCTRISAKIWTAQKKRDQMLCFFSLFVRPESPQDRPRGSNLFRALFSIASGVEEEQSAGQRNDEYPFATVSLKDLPVYFRILRTCESELIHPLKKRCAADNDLTCGY